MEMIEVNGLDGFGYSHQCGAPNFGSLAMRYPVADALQARSLITERGGTIWRDVARVSLGEIGDVDLLY